MKIPLIDNINLLILYLTYSVNKGFNVCLYFILAFLLLRNDFNQMYVYVLCINSQIG